MSVLKCFIRTYNLIIILNDVMSRSDLSFVIISYQLKLTKMRAELANLNHCVVPFLNCAAELVLVLLYKRATNVITSTYQHRLFFNVRKYESFLPLLVSTKLKEVLGCHRDYI